MSLSEDEQHRLGEIESLTAAADPQFARRLDLLAASRRRRAGRWACWVLFAVGIGLICGGVAAAHGFISVGAVVAGLGWALMAWSGMVGYGLRTRRA